MIGYMLYLYGITKITAADLCILCYYGMQAGAYGEGFELYGLPQTWILGDTRSTWMPFSHRLPHPQGIIF